MNWLDQLQAFKDANPDLPEGVEPQPEPTFEDTPSMHPRVDISFEKKGRGGKTVTLISGWEVSDEKLQEIASMLKKSLAVGGSACGGEILIQGDRRENVARKLKEMGYKCRVI